MMGSKKKAFRTWARSVSMDIAGICIGLIVITVIEYEAWLRKRRDRL